VRNNHVLIDFENVQVNSLALLAGDQFRVYLFLGPHHAKLPRPLVLAMHGLGERAKYIELEAPGPNALDFHIAYYLGNLAAADPDGFFHVISKDTGFDPLIKHLKSRKIFAARSEAIEAMPCFRPAAAGPAPANGVDSLVKLAVDDLTKRKASKPRKVATLHSTVAARIGKEAEASLDAVLDSLVRAGHVAIEGVKVTYQLPS
jgi:hypothetical protein